jgi:hypothetical protein
MATDAGSKQPVASAETAREAFHLERFAWGGPDRLELAGRFVGLREAPGDAPVLVVRGPEREHRLPAVPETWPGPPTDGEPWEVAFAWQEAPEPFSTAQLELGADFVVALPEPVAKRPRFRNNVVEVQRAVEPEPAPAPPAPEPAEEQAPSTPDAPAAADGGADRLRLHTELLTAEQRVHELEAQAEQARSELAHARQTLASEQQRHAADAERFREGIAQVRESAEQAMAAEREAGARLQAEADEARAAAKTLRERVAELEREQQTAQADLEVLTAARDAADSVRADAERLLSGLETLRGSLGGNG